MTADSVKAQLQSVFSDATISVHGEGAKFELAIVSDVFEGKRAVARQQMVYAVLNDDIASGAIHAVTMQLKTHSEAQ